MVISSADQPRAKEIKDRIADLKDRLSTMGPETDTYAFTADKIDRLQEELTALGGDNQN